MGSNVKIRFWDIVLSSVISFFFTAKCYNFLYDKITWNNLADFYAGTSIYNNHNKYLDICIYFIYLFLFFVIFTLVFLLRNKFFKKSEQLESVQTKTKKSCHTEALAEVSSPNYQSLRFFASAQNDDLCKHIQVSHSADISDKKTFFSICQKFQYLFVFGFVLLHPFNGSLYPKIILLILLLMITAFVDIYRNKQGFSSLALSALLFIFCFCSYNINMIADDHHFGEKFTAFFMHNNFNLEYYKDIMLVHGFKDVTGAFLGNFFFNQNNVQGYFLGELLENNIILIITIILTLSLFNKNIIYTLPLLIYRGFSTSIAAIAVYMLLIREIARSCAVLSVAQERAIKTVYWLYIIFAVIFSCYWTTIGSFWVIASLPAFTYICYKLKNKKLHFSLACLALFLILSVFHDSIFEYFHQVKYYIHGTLYAFGNDFSGIKKMPFLIFCNWIYKLFALFFIPVLILEAIKQYKNKSIDIKKNMFILFPLLFVFVSLKYTLGRMDGGTFQRLEFISLPFLCIIAPYWIYKFSELKQRILTEKFLTFMLAIYMIFSGIFVLPLKFKKIDYDNSQQEKRLAQIKEFLSLRNSEETFLDMTNRGMHYLYFNKKIPVQFTSFYNSITSKQAWETVEKLKNNIPDVILIFSKNIIYDNIFPSLRINPIYRWIFLEQKYEYKAEGENVFLIKTDNPIKYTKEQLNDLDIILAAGNLKFLPEVWANSLKTLPLIRVLTNYNVEIYGNEIKIRFLEPQKVQNLDLLYFNTNEKRLTDFRISINNSSSKILCSSKSGKILVPMDNFPSWLLNDKLEEITIETNITVKSLELEFYKKRINMISKI